MLFLSYLLLVGCARGHLHVQQGWIDASTLASTHLGTPDRRQEDPPLGEQLVVSWAFPQSLLEKEPYLELTVRFWNGEEKTYVSPIKTHFGYTDFFFEKSTPHSSNRVLTYLVRGITKEGEVVALFEHQLWTPLIEIGDN